MCRRHDHRGTHSPEIWARGLHARIPELCAGPAGEHRRACSWGAAMKSIKPIHPYGPPVGKWKSHGTVAETFARIRREQAQQQARESENRSEAEQKVAPLK